MVSQQPSLSWDDLEEYEEWDPTKGSFAIHAAAGSLAGAAEHSVMYPFDTIKTYAQADSRYNGWRGLRKVIHREGFMRLWRGVSTMLSASLPAHAAYFSIYEISKESFGANCTEHVPLAAGASGALATLAHDGIMTPMDVAKQRLQLGYHKGVLNCLHSILRNEGISALFISYPTTLLMNVPYAAITVATNESLKKVLNPKNEYSLPAFLLSGAGAGALASACTNPLDVVKTRLQTQAMLDSINKVGGAIPSTSTSKHLLFKSEMQEHNRNKFRLRVGLGLRYHYSLPKNTSRGMGLSVGIPCSNGARLTSFINFVRSQRRSLFDSANPGKLRYKGLVDAARSIYAQEGYYGFMRGLKPRLMVHTPSVAISWTAYETGKEFLIRLQ